MHVKVLIKSVSVVFYTQYSYHTGMQTTLWVWLFQVLVATVPTTFTTVTEALGFGLLQAVDWPVAKEPPTHLHNHGYARPSSLQHY